MKEDIKILEQFLVGNKYCEGCEEKCVDCYIEYEEVQAVANLLTRYKQLEQENNNYKAAALKNDDLYKEVCNKNKELEKENEKLTYARNWYFEHFTARELTPEQLDKILRFDYIPKSLVKEKIEELDKQIAEFSQNIKYSTGEEKIFWKRQRAELVGARNILISLLGEEK